MVGLLAAAVLSLQADLRADAGLPCPAHATLLSALRRNQAAYPQIDARTVLDYRGGFWRLELRRAGAVLLRRTLALPAGDCELLAETAALVIDRYFREVRSPRRPAPHRQLAALGPLPRAAAPAVPAAAAVAELSAPPDDPPRAVLIPSLASLAADSGSDEPLRASDLVVSAGVAALDDLRPGLWLQAERRWRSGSASFLLVAGSADHDFGPVRESALQSALFALSIGPCFEAYVRACFAPVAGARGTTGQGRGRLHPQPALRLSPALGATISVDRTVMHRLNLGLSLLVGRTLGEAAFDPAAPPQEIDYAAALRLGLAF